MANVIRDDKVEQLREQLEATELDELERAMSYSLADAIREGSTVTGQKHGDWTDDTGDNVCALSAGLIAAKARRMI